MTIDDIALVMLHGIGPVGCARLISLFGSAEEIFGRSQSELVAVGVEPILAKNIASKSTHRMAEKEIGFMQRNDIYAVAATDDDYPSLLRECNDYPHVLFFRGDISSLQHHTISVVGTRGITPYGQRMTDVLVGHLAELLPDVTIVSGLAFGVDGAAHRAALAARVATVAFIPSVLSSITPPQHGRLAEDILASGGALVSEYHSQSKQNGNFYIPRNRLIAGVSEGTLVVESPREGGSMATAELAYGYERVVMAVPGRAGDRCSEGTNLLIRSRRAAMVCSATDVVRELGWDLGREGVVLGSRAEESLPLSDDERRVMECFGEGESLGIDLLVERSGMAVGVLNATLLGLEIGGYLRQLPGKCFERC